jgi:hypothetical protein
MLYLEEFTFTKEEDACLLLHKTFGLSLRVPTSLKPSVFVIAVVYFFFFLHFFLINGCYFIVRVFSSSWSIVCVFHFLIRV